MVKKLGAILLFVLMAGTLMATMHAPFTDSSPPTNLAYKIWYKQLYDIADSAGGDWEYIFPGSCFGAFVHHSDDKDSIWFSIEDLYMEDTTGKLGDNFVAKMFPLLDSAADTLALFGVDLGGYKLKIGNMIYRDTLDTLFIDEYILDVEGTARIHENLE